jgi:hypothetical protein
LGGRSIVPLLVFAVVHTAPAFAQVSQYLDFMRFTLPAGEWRVETGEGYQGFNHPVPVRGFCRLTVQRTTPSRGGLTQDAAADWNAFILARYPGASNYQTRTVPLQGTAWTFTQQTAIAKVDGTEMLLSVHTFTGHGQHMSLLFENTHQPFDDFVNQVIGGLSMSAPASAPGRPNLPPQNAPGKPASLLGKWQRTSSVLTPWGPASTQGHSAWLSYSQGYTRWLYDFQPDGSFTLSCKTWPLNGDRMYYRRESGAFRLEGEGFTLTPQKSVSECWSKQPGHLDDPDQLLSRQTNPLESATYRFVYHYSSGIKEWNLILMTERETGRDGKFDGGTLFPNGWFYKRVGAEETGE